MPCLLPCRVLFWAVLLAQAPAARGQDRPAPRQSPAIAVATAVGLKHPLTSAAVLPRGTASARAEKLDLSAWLIEDKTPVASLRRNSAEYTAYAYVLVKAHATDPAALARAARRDLTFAHLFEEPDKYRGDIVHLEGQVKRIRRFDPPALAAREGVRDFYEAWLFNDDLYGTRPACLVFSELPPGMQVGEKVNYRVSFDGYFFKCYRYETGNERWLNAPLLIGRTLTALPTAPAEDAEEGLYHGTGLVLLFLGLLAATLFLALGLAWWYRRGDRRIRERLQAARMPAVMDDQPAWLTDERSG